MSIDQACTVTQVPASVFGTKSISYPDFDPKKKK